MKSRIRHGVKPHPCSKCGRYRWSYEVFETGWKPEGRQRLRYWCLDHIPWRYRLKVWIQERWHG